MAERRVRSGALLLAALALAPDTAGAGDTHTITASATVLSRFDRSAEGLHTTSRGTPKPRESFRIVRPERVSAAHDRDRAPDSGNPVESTGYILLTIEP